VRFVETPLAGACVIELEPMSDSRGFFARAFCEREFEAHGLPVHWPQSNLSRNAGMETLRGMHFNAANHEEAKIVRCVSGAIWDVIVDLRPQSPTRLRWHGVKLSAPEGNALYVPEGFAHGFITLADGTDVFYQMSRFFEPSAARGFRWNDPRVGIDWPIMPTRMSDRDRTYPDLNPERPDG
jgi:dTDP-4-dehydrorhamnose 3,5-epimerase